MTPVDIEHDPLATTTLGTARHRLLDARVPAGHWEGELSSSALSTATASFALWLHARSAPATAPPASLKLARAGVHWLVTNQNRDGGWGDTTLSRTNISTTALCWAALGAIGSDDSAVQLAAEKATAWLKNAAGSVEPAPLSEAIARRYGDDRTFSVPILTMCALAGRLGTGTQAWRHVPQLPFELAAFPQGFFRFLRLPVVSYALPALIAIGLVRHRHRPSWNPIGRAVRALTEARTLRVLRKIQPPGGGFLEATPLTSFVVMSLVAAGEADHPVVREGVEFLVRSVRPDGSWPIDTNLATWVTTLSIGALAADGRLHEHLSAPDRATLRGWLLGQQYRQRHAYTGAAPGGWAWTDLPGGVPDADDTAGALVALHTLGDIDDQLIDAASAGVNWLLGLQNRDGGIPTFCRGWGKLPFDRSAPELTAHALHAWSLWRTHVSPPLKDRIDRATAWAFAYLRKAQRPDGSWIPLWFGNEGVETEENPTHGTSRVVASLRIMGASGDVVESMVARGVQWLLAAQNDDGGWGGARGIRSTIEETAHALSALTACTESRSNADALSSSISRAAVWLQSSTNEARDTPSAPIGLYFAKLWYSERLYPLIGITSALGTRACPSKPLPA